MSISPLAGVRILSLAQQWPGPFATMILADLGADVILVERPDGGDPSRRHPGLFSSMNRGKRSVAIDLKSASGREDFLRLIDTADCVLEGFRPGVMDRLGFGAQKLRERKPELIFVSISSFGQDGPLSSVAGHDLSIQAAAGMINVPAGKEASTSLPVLPLADIASAMYGALAILTALFDRSRSGLGAQIDVSMLDSLLSWMAPFIVPGMNGLPIRPLPPEDPGYGLFATSDGKQITLSIAGEDHMWSSLCELVELPQYIHLTEQERSERHSEVLPDLRQAISRFSRDEICKRLEAANIAFGPVIAVNDVPRNPHVLARRMIVELQEGESVQSFVRQPLIINGGINSITRPAPRLGEHTKELLR